QAVLGLFVLVASACSAPPSGPLAVHQPGRILGARDVGHADPNEIVDLVIGLRTRPGVAEYVSAQADRRSSTYGKLLLPAAFGERFGPSVADYARVLAWAEARDLEIVRQTPSRTTLSVRGTVTTVERAFGTELDLWQDARGTFRAPTTHL